MSIFGWLTSIFRTSQVLERRFVCDWRFDNLSWSQFDSKSDYTSVRSIVETMAYDGQLYGLVGSWGMQRYSFLVNCPHLSFRRVGENKQQRTKRKESVMNLPRNFLGNNIFIVIPQPISVCMESFNLKSRKFAKNAIFNISGSSRSKRTFRANGNKRCCCKWLWFAYEFPFIVQNCVLLDEVSFRMGNHLELLTFVERWHRRHRSSKDWVSVGFHQIQVDFYRVDQLDT